MASNTPNLDLYKKDPIADASDTFNITTMLNENWDKIDEGVGELDDTVASHTSNKSNPHGVTKSQVGLGSVQNYGLATQSDAETGTSNTKYMTPLRTQQSIDKNLAPIQQEITSHLADYAQFKFEAENGKVSKSGDTMQGILTAYSNTSYTLRQVRNIVLSTDDADVNAMLDGDIWIKYESEV